MADDSKQSTSPSRTIASRIALPAQDEDIASVRRALIAKLTYAVGKDPEAAMERDWFIATALASPMFAEEKVDLAVIHQIKAEAFQNSKVMDHEFYLTDVYGPRLTNSPNYFKSADWVVKQLNDWGIKAQKFIGNGAQRSSLCPFLIFIRDMRHLINAPRIASPWRREVGRL